MLSELLGKKKPAARQHNVAIAELALDLGRLKAALEEQVDEKCRVSLTLRKTSQRLDEIPDAFKDCEIERFEAMTRWDLHPEKYENREPEFGERRASLVKEQETLTGKREALATQYRQLDKQVSDLKYTVDQAERAVYEAIAGHLAAELNANFREQFIALWCCLEKLRDGCGPVVALDHALDMRTLDDATRVAGLETLRKAYDVP